MPEDSQQVVQQVVKISNVSAATQEKFKKAWPDKRIILLLKSKGYTITKENRAGLIHMVKHAPALLQSTQN